MLFFFFFYSLELIQNTRINRVQMLKMTQLRHLANQRCSGLMPQGDRLTFPRILGLEGVANLSLLDI